MSAALRIDELVQRLDAQIPEEMSDRNVPGLAIGLCDADETLWAAAYGTTARAGDIPVRTSTRFSVQSTSKLFTATLVLIAAQQSVVDLDEPITTYLPDFVVNSIFDEKPEDLIALRHLLAHTAGLAHEAPIGSNFDMGTGDFDAHCRSIFGTWLRFAVGHHYEYSNLGIDLAGYALQRVAKVGFPELARRELFEPLDLSRTTFDAGTIETDPERAIGHWRPFDDAGLTLPVAVPMVAAGGLYTSVDDALRFVRFQLRNGEPLLTRELVADQRRLQFALPGQELGYGLGVYIDEWEPGVRVLHHGGSGFGFQSQLCWLPDVSLGVVVLTNSFDHSLQNEFAHQVVRHVAEQLPKEPRTAPPLSEDLGAQTAPDGRAVSTLVGEYVGRFDERREVVAENGRLFLRGTETWPASIVAPRTIEVATPERERYIFSEGQSAELTYLHSLRTGQVWYRNEPVRDTPSELNAADVGTYVACSWGVPSIWYRVAQDGPSPIIQQVRAVDEPAVPRVALRLAPIGRDIYMSSVGEVLDLTSPTPRYANVELVKVDDEH